FEKHEAAIVDPSGIDPYEVSAASEVVDRYDGDERPREPHGGLSVAFEPDVGRQRGTRRAVEFDDDSSAGREQPCGSLEEGDGVAADADVSVEEEHGGPAAFAGERVEH